MPAHLETTAPFQRPDFDAPIDADAYLRACPASATTRGTFFQFVVDAVEKEKRKLLKNLEGIRNMGRLPDAIFIVDTRKEKIAVDEARKLKIPVIGIVDTNCDPDEVDYVIPGNDDALRSIRLFAGAIAESVLAGRGMRESRDAEQAAAQGDENVRSPSR